MLRTRLVCLVVAGFCLLTLAACGGPAAAPTPTPTKTPLVVAAVEPSPTPVPPTPVPPTPAPAVALVPTHTPTPQPGNIAPYSGLPAQDVAALQRRPVMVCINNDPVGRSAHYGLGLADLVYEYIVDGFTLTRITALYQGNPAPRIGPVRSARLPNVWMTYMYDGIIACSGGSDEVRYLLKNEVGFPYLDADIDDPSNNVYFQSIGDDYRTRMQASPDGVRRWINDLLAKCQANPTTPYCATTISNWTSGDFVLNEWSRPGFQFSPEPSPNFAGQATVITIPYPGGNGVEWRYDPTLGGYIRFQGGQQQVDLATGQPIVASNVIIAAAEHELTNIVEDSAGTFGVDIKLYGFGDFRIFRDGNVYEGTWRADPENPPRWLGPGEVLIQLKPGQSWVQVVRELGEVSYQ